MGEVTSAVIATSLVLIAVFVPVSFFPGTTGILYRQFSLTIAFSIAISAFNALTLRRRCPPCFFAAKNSGRISWTSCTSGRISRAFAAFVHGADATITWICRTYARTIHFALRIRYVLLVLFFAGLAATVCHLPARAHRLHSRRKIRATFCVIVQAPPGSSLEYTSSAGRPRHGASLRKIPTLLGAFSVMGFSFSGGASNAGPDVCRHQAGRPAPRQRPLGRRHLWPDFRPSCRC